LSKVANFNIEPTSLHLASPLGWNFAEIFGNRKLRVQGLCHKVPIGYNRAPQNCTFPWDDRRSPPSSTCLIRPTNPNGIQIQSAIFPQSTGQTHRQTNRCSRR